MTDYILMRYVVPQTATPPVRTTALWVPNEWVDTPHGEATALHRVPVDVLDFYAQPKEPHDHP